MTNLPGSPSAFPSGGSKVIRGVIVRKEGEPGNEATQCCCQTIVVTTLKRVYTLHIYPGAKVRVIV